MPGLGGLERDVRVVHIRSGRCSNGDGGRRGLRSLRGLVGSLRSLGGIATLLLVTTGVAALTRAHEFDLVDPRAVQRQAALQQQVGPGIVSFVRLVLLICHFVFLHFIDRDGLIQFGIQMELVISRFYLIVIIDLRRYA